MKVSANNREHVGETEKYFQSASSFTYLKTVTSDHFTLKQASFLPAAPTSLPSSPQAKGTFSAAAIEGLQISPKS